jgi:hypothetical protein
MGHPSTLTNELRSQGGKEVQRRYGSDYIAARMRRGLIKNELAKVRHPERLTPEIIDQMMKQALIRQAAKMRVGRARVRAEKAAALAAEQAKAAQDGE